MITFTHDEINLMALYDTGTRLGLISELTEMRRYLDENEIELRVLTDSVLTKLDSISDVEYEEFNLIPEFDY